MAGRAAPDLNDIIQKDYTEVKTAVWIVDALADDLPTLVRLREMHGDKAQKCGNLAAKGLRSASNHASKEYDRVKRILELRQKIGSSRRHVAGGSQVMQELLWLDDNAVAHALSSVDKARSALQAFKVKHSDYFPPERDQASVPAKVANFPEDAEREGNIIDDATLSKEFESNGSDIARHRLECLFAIQGVYAILQSGCTSPDGVAAARSDFPYAPWLVSIGPSLLHKHKRKLSDGFSDEEESNEKKQRML